MAIIIIPMANPMIVLFDNTNQCTYILLKKLPKIEVGSREFSIKDMLQYFNINCIIKKEKSETFVIFNEITLKKHHEADFLQILLLTS